MREFGLDNFYIELYENYGCDNVERRIEKERRGKYKTNGNIKQINCR
jgi:hypothetical protein